MLWHYHPNLVYKFLNRMLKQPHWSLVYKYSLVISSQWRCPHICLHLLDQLSILPASPNFKLIFSSLKQTDMTMIYIWNLQTRTFVYTHSQTPDHSANTSRDISYCKTSFTFMFVSLLIPRCAFFFLNSCILRTLCICVCVCLTVARQSHRRF